MGWEDELGPLVVVRFEQGIGCVRERRGWGAWYGGGFEAMGCLREGCLRRWGLGMRGRAEWGDAAALVV